MSQRWEASSTGERLSSERHRTEAEVRRVLRDAPKALTAPEGLHSAGHKVLRRFSDALSEYGEADNKWLGWQKERHKVRC